MRKALAIIGARPQFIKHYPLELACSGKVELITIHTGQHYDENMSKVFFDQLGMSKPDYILEHGGGSHGKQTGRMMESIEEIVLKEQPEVMIVYGDTNSTLAGALVAAKLHIPIAHIEAGLRSYNRNMPEEINRVMTDHLSTWLFTPSEVSVENLKKEGITKGVHVVGDIMKDVLFKIKDQGLLTNVKVPDYPFYYVTLHRPYNVDEKERLKEVLNTLNSLDKKAIFAIHPRTRNNMKNLGLDFSDFPNIEFIEPQPYVENIAMVNASSGVITDSGGMQKEVYWMEKPCVTVRSETEWVETLVGGANHLVFENLTDIQSYLKTGNIDFDQSLYGDGKAAEKMVKMISESKF